MSSERTSAVDSSNGNMTVWLLTDLSTLWPFAYWTHVRVQFPVPDIYFGM